MANKRGSEYKAISCAANSRRGSIISTPLDGRYSRKNAKARTKRARQEIEKPKRVDNSTEAAYCSRSLRGPTLSNVLNGVALSGDGSAARAAVGREARAKAIEKER